MIIIISIIIVNYQLMHSSEKVKAYSYMKNCEVELHSEQQISQLIKKGIIQENIAEHNKKLGEFLNENKKTSQKKKNLIKQVNLSEIERIQVANNWFKSEEQLILKVPNTANLNSNQRKNILQH